MISPILTAIAEKFVSDLRNLLTKKGVLPAIAAVAVIAIVALIFLRSFTNPTVATRKQLDLVPLIVTDPNGDTWQLDLIKGQSLDTFTDADPGPPLIVQTNVKIVGKVASIGLIVQGQAGELYVGGVKKNGDWQPPPAIKIIDSRERVLGADRFKYG